MAWRRGLFRLWIVLSVLWVVNFGIFGTWMVIDGANWQERAGEWAYYPAEFQSSYCAGVSIHECNLRFHHAEIPKGLLWMWSVALIGPALLLFAGFVVGWVLRGFRTESK